MAEYQEIVRTWRRMCDYYDHCCNCPFGLKNDGAPVGCAEFITATQYSKRAEQIILKWEKAHPVETPSPASGHIKPGEHFAYKGQEWVALDIVDGAENSGKGVLSILATTLPEERRFDEDGCNNWAASSLRSWMNTDLLDETGEDRLLPHETDLIADNGDKAYGKVIDKLFVLSCDEYRKYRDLIPKYDRWVWTCTPWGTSATGDANHVRYVRSTGDLRDDDADSSNGVVPACIFRI